MVDWNHNGKRDSFDFAMDMMAMEEMERGSSKKSSYKSSKSDSDDAFYMGCTMYMIVLIMGPLITAFMFLVEGEGGIALGIIALGIAVNALVFQFVLAPQSNSSKPGSKTNSANKMKSSNGQIIYDADEDYQYTFLGQSVAISGYIRTYRSVIKIPTMIKYMPVQYIESGAFRDCKDLCKIIIPQYVISIAKDALPPGRNITIYGTPNSYAQKFAQQNGMVFKDVKLFEEPKSHKTAQTQNNTTKEAPKKDAAPNNSQVKTAASSANVNQTSNSPSVKRMGYYDVVRENGGLTIKKFVGVDKAVLTVPMMLDDIPVRVIDTGAFCDCKYVEKVMIGEGILAIRNGAFDNCPNLRNVVLPSTLKSFGNDSELKQSVAQQAVFHNCPLQSINMPSSVINIGNNAFYKNEKLSQILIPDSVECIGANAFFGTAIQDVHIPAGLQRIGDGAFRSTLLRSVTIPGSLTQISNQAFCDCTQLKQATLHEGIVKIKGEAFKGCSSLKEICIPKSVQEIGRDAFSTKGYGAANKNLDITLYCYGGSAGLEYARANNFAYKDAGERENVELLKPNIIKVETKPNLEEKVRTETVSAIVQKADITSDAEKANDVEREALLHAVHSCLQQITEKEKNWDAVIKQIAQDVAQKAAESIVQHIAQTAAQEVMPNSEWDLIKDESESADDRILVAVYYSSPEEDTEATNYGRIIRHSKYTVIFRTDYEDKGKTVMAGNMIIWKETLRIKIPFGIIAGCESYRDGNLHESYGRLTGRESGTDIFDAALQTPKNGLVLHFIDYEPYVLEYVRNNEELRKVYDTIKYILGNRDGRNPFRKLSK